jgi:hypothetical protein
LAPLAAWNARVLRGVVRDMRVRGASVACVIVVVVLMTALPASAKLPPWTCELSTTRPVVGEPVTVEVRYWWDPEHTEPARMAIFRRLRNSFEARAIDHGEPGEYQLGVIPITLPRVSPSTYRGEVVFPDTRRFRIVGCGGGYDKWGYPLRRGVVIVPRQAINAEGSGPPVTAFTGIIVLAALAVGTLKTARLHRWPFKNRVARPGRLERH